MFHDVIAMIGTNPAIMLVKEHILDTTKVDTVQAISMIQSALTAVRTPTLELITELITLVKTNLKPLAAERTILYNIAIVQTSNLIHKVLVLDRTEHMSVRTRHPNLTDRNKSGPCVLIFL